MRKSAGTEKTARERSSWTTRRAKNSARSRLSFAPTQDTVTLEMVQRVATWVEIDEAALSW